MPIGIFLYGGSLLVPTLQTEKIKPLPVVLVRESYWRRAIDFDFMIAEGMISPDDMRLFVFRETAEAIWAAIVHWHEAHDGSLIGRA